LESTSSSAKVTESARASDFRAAKYLVARLEMTGIDAKELSVGNACNPPNREFDGEYGAGMVTSMDGGLENHSGTMGRVSWPGSPSGSSRPIARKSRIDSTAAPPS
jgi:hypothetical protein